MPTPTSTRSQVTTRSSQSWELDYWGASAREGISRLHKAGLTSVSVQPAQTVGVPFGAASYTGTFGEGAGIYVFSRWGFTAATFGCNKLFEIKRDGHEIGEGADARLTRRQPVTRAEAARAAADAMKRVERHRLTHRILASQQQLAPRRGSRPTVLQLEPVGVDGLELDPLDLSLAPQLDHRHAAVPRVVDEERALAPDHLELVALRAVPCRSRTGRARRRGTASSPRRPSRCRSRRTRQAPPARSGSPPSSRDALTQ